MIKFFFKPALLIVFSIAFFCATAQIGSSDAAQNSLFNRVEHLTDSLEKTQGSKNVAADTQSTKIKDLKEIDIAGSFQEAEVFGDVTVILTNGPKDKLWLKGEGFDMEHTKVSIRNGKLIVKAGYKTRSKLQVYVPALGLASLVINGDSEIFSSGTINANALQIILNGTSMVSIRCHGKVDVFSGERTELISVDDYRKIVSSK